MLAFKSTWKVGPIFQAQNGVNHEGIGTVTRTKSQITFSDLVQKKFLR